MRRVLSLLLLAGVPVLSACADRGADDAAPDQAGGDTAAAASDPGVFSIADIGLETPESVLYDDHLDMYIVSNINGAPTGRDGNGFISRLRPGGDVVALKWIDGEAAGVRLNAPKGMAFRGDTLFVADIDTVRMFHRTTGAPLGAVGIPNAVFLNDIAVGDDGVYVSDTGVDPNFTPLGRDAIYRLGGANTGGAAGGGVTAVATGRPLMQPNGIVIDGGNVLMVPFGANALFSIPIGGGRPTRVTTLPAGQLDGIVRLPNGALLISSWEGRAVYRVSPSGAITTEVENVEAPADIGWDSRRQRLLIPLFMANRIEVREIR